MISDCKLVFIEELTPVIEIRSFNVVVIGLVIFLKRLPVHDDLGIGQLRSELKLKRSIVLVWTDAIDQTEFIIVIVELLLLLLFLSV